MNPNTTLWFNHSISSLDVILRAIRAHPVLGVCRVIVTNKFPASNLMDLCDVYQVEPNLLKTEDYVSWCRQFAKDHKVDVFFPQRHADQVLLHHDVFSASGTEVIMHTGSFEPHLLESKAWVYGELEAEGMSNILPNVWESTAEMKTVVELMDQSEYPLCIKPDRGIYGEGFFVLHKGQGLSITHSPPLVGIDTLQHVFAYLYQNKPCLVSEFLPGTEYSVDCAFDRGVLLSAVVRQKTSRKEQHVFTMRDDCSQKIQSLFENARRIGNLLSLNGWSNIQFKENGEGEPVFLEVNPRFSGGLGIAAMANPELPLIPVFNALGLWQGGMNSFQNHGKGITASIVYSLLQAT